ncbi:cytochrome C oxidase subunit IV family protein [Saccharicrinis fermentans]|uniref:cytochrome C oxidase subunit IV family protein n=1 Tax=Saccharicrinis fermentans TaxID=982 RepID=UPI00047F77F7|nr:cytochrome C oxidase subunit IV family protein [Saccharicrinis fermentans]
MDNHSESHIVPYKTYLYILAILLALTGITVGAAYVEFGQLTIFVTLLLASIKSTLVLIYFMHLKFDNRIIQIIVPTIFILVTLVLIVTFLDYNFR